MKHKLVIVSLVLALVALPLVAACAKAPAPAPTPTASPSLTPHPLVGRANYLTCHETGISDTSAIPADHIGRTNDLYVLCYQPASG